MKTDKYTLEVLQENCNALAAVIADQANKAAVKDAEQQIVETAMMLCGYYWNTDLGRYERQENDNK